MDYFLGFLAGYFWKKVIDFLRDLPEDVDRRTNWMFEKYE